MKRIDVVKDGDNWLGKSGGRMVPGTKAPTKAETVKEDRRGGTKGRRACKRESPTKRTAGSKKSAPIQGRLIRRIKKVCTRGSRTNGAVRTLGSSAPLQSSTR